MKGIIVEKNMENTVLLLSDGTFKTVKISGDMEIGTVIFMHDTAHGSAFYVSKLVSMIAAALLIVYLGAGVCIWTTPVQYINIDINPSVEFAVNRFDRIIRIVSLNDDGERLLETVSLHAQKVDAGVRRILDNAKEMGYLKEEGDVLVSISSQDSLHGEKTKARILEKVEENIEVMTFGIAARALSAQNSLSPGKNNIIDRVIASGTNLTKMELMEVPVKDLMQKIRENQKLANEAEKEEKQLTKE